MKLCACSAIAIAASAMAAPVMAQDAHNGGIEEIVVEARKTAENLQTVPVAVTVPTGETLLKAQVNSLDQLTQVVPGLVIQASTNQPASAFIGIRGQAASDALLAIDQAVGQYFDGVYVARSSGALFNFVDVQRVEVLRGAQGTLFGRNTTGGAVSVVSNKPTGELGGSMRVGYGNHDQFEATGVLNLPLQGDAIALRLVGQHTENGSYGTNLSFNTGLGAEKANSVRGTLRIAPAGSPLTVSIIGDYAKRNSQGQVVGLKSFSPNATASGLITACSGPTANALCPVKTPAGDTFARYAIFTPGNGMYDNHFYDGYLSTIPYSRAVAWGAGATIEYEVSDATTLKSITAWRGVRTDSLGDNDGTPYALTGGLHAGEGNIIRQHQFSEEVQLSTKALADRLQVIVGAYYFTENGNDLSLSYSAFPLGTRRIGVNDGDIRNKSYAGFGQANFNLTDTLRLTAGLRYTKDDRSILRRNRGINTDPVTGFPLADIPANYVCALTVTAGSPCSLYAERSFHYWSYTAGFDWRPVDNVFVYVKTNKASRAGGFNPRAIGDTGLSFEPETVKDYEIGFKLDLLDRRLRINTAIFNTDYSGIQRTVPAIIGGILSNTIVNAATARIRGFETEVTVQPTTGLQLGLSVTHLDPKFKDFSILQAVTPATTPATFFKQDVTATPFSFVSRWSYSAYLDYRMDVGPGELGLRADYAWRTASFTTGPLIGPANPSSGAANYQSIYATTARIPAYGLLNGQISYHLKNPDVEISLYARNLTNKKYITRLLAVENSLGVTGYSPGMPRMFGVRLGYKFGGEAR